MKLIKERRFFLLEGRGIVIVEFNYGRFKGVFLFDWVEVFGRNREDEGLCVRSGS